MIWNNFTKEKTVMHHIHTSKLLKNCLTEIVLVSRRGFITISSENQEREIHLHHHQKSYLTTNNERR